MSLSKKNKNDPGIISLGINLFNITYFNKEHIKKGMLGRVIMPDKKSIFTDYYSRIVTHTMSKTNWYEIFRLNFNETLDLEYSTFIYLKEILDEYEEEMDKRLKEEKRKVK